MSTAAGKLGFRPRAAAFLRTLAVQGSFNYRTMIGGGFAFALLPFLRGIHGEDTEAADRAIARHVSHFNSHPYLVGIAVGAVARMEAEGERPEVIERFKTALSGPLGGLGDRLVWARWLPVTLLMAFVLGMLGLRLGLVLGGFLVVYNVGHLLLRSWSLAVGLEHGREVGARLRAADLGGMAAKLARVGSLLTGVLLGLLLITGAGRGWQGWVWVVAMALSFTLGSWLGSRAWRPAALGLVAAVLGAALLGGFR